MFMCTLTIHIHQFSKKSYNESKKMSNNAGTCQIVKFEPMNEVDEKLASFAENFFEVVANDYTDDGKEQLVGYMRQNASEQQLLEAADRQEVKLPKYEISTISSDDWLTENVIKFAPVEVADFLVYGIHENVLDCKDKIGIRVYAATAFGSEHQTTKGCLQAISDINKLVVPKKVLDVGTGSGILSLAAAKLWSEAKIVAVDIDDESVLVTKQNAIDNGVDRQIIAAYSDGYNSAIVQENAPYDVIFANILARPLIEMAPQMFASLKKGGYAVISGFIEDQIDWVISEHEAQGLKLKKIYQQDNWCAALLEK